MLATTFWTLIAIGVTGLFGATVLYRLNLSRAWAVLTSAAFALPAFSFQTPPFWVGFLAPFVSLYCLITWAQQDAKTGGRHARAAANALGPLDIARRQRAKRLPAVDDSTYLLGHDNRRMPVRLPLARTSGRHQLLLGATGTGKTVTLMATVARHVEAGFAAVVVDLKGDRQVATRLEQLAADQGARFSQFTLDGGVHWNPLARGNRSELKDKLMGGEEFSERHYEAMYERYLVNVFRAIELAPELRRIDQVVKLLNPDALRVTLRGLGHEESAHEINDYLAGLSEAQKQQLSGLRDRLALLIEGGPGKFLLPSPIPEADLDLLRAIEGGEVVCFSLNSSSSSGTAKLIANVISQDLKAVIGSLERNRAGVNGFAGGLIAVDEFSALDSDNLVGLFQRGRSAGISLVLATQELADLRRVADGFTEQVMGNVEVIIAGRQNVPESAEAIARAAGTEEAWVHTLQTGHKGDRPRSLFARDSGMGSKRLGERFLIHPNDIKRLGVGEAVVIQKSPPDARVVRVQA